jgi:flagellar assembly protein FliH
MSSVIIPKERLTAYQRWEMASFDLEEEEQTAAAKQQESEIGDMREAARSSGYAEGYTTGLEAARADLDKQKKAFQQMTDNLQAEIGRVGQSTADEMVKLALDIAKAMLRHAMVVRPELLLPVVQDALSRLPALVHPIQLAVNSGDARLLKQVFADEIDSLGLKIRVDNTLTQGGCKVETHASQVDATVESRWKRIALALDQSGDWLE